MMTWWKQHKARIFSALVGFGFNAVIGLAGTPMSAWAAPSIDVKVHIIHTPDAVTDLAAAAVGSANGDIQLAWKAPGNLNGMVMNHYLIRYATYPASGAGTAESWWDSQAVTQNTISPAQAPGVQEFTILHSFVVGTKYYFGIKAVDVDGQVSPIDLRVGLSNQAQSYPVDLSGSPPNTPLNFAGVAISSTQIRWSWDDTPSANFYTLNTYPAGNLVAQTTNLFILETGLTPNTGLVRTIRAANTNGLSTPTAALTVYSLAVPPVSLSIPRLGFTSISLDWNAANNSNSTQYRIERSNDGINFVVVTQVSTTNYVDSGLLELTSYYYRVRAINGDGIQTVPSLIVSTMTPLQVDFIQPVAPSGLKGIVDGSGNVFTLSWEVVTRNIDDTPCTDLKGYNIYRRTSLLGARTKMTPTPLTVTAFADQVSNHLYYYTITAVDTSGNESEESLFADSSLDENIIYLSSDSISSIVMPQSINDLLRSGFNNLSIPLTIRMQEEPVASATQIIRQVTFSLVRSDNGVEVKGLAFSRPHAIVAIGYNAVGGHVVQGSPAITTVNPAAVTAATPNDLSLYFYNGASWVKVGGTLDVAAQAVKTRTSYLGLYQLRIAARATALTLDQANVFPRVFSPNGDGFNDRVYFVLENPNNAEVSGEIFDMAGRVVATLPAASANAGIGTTLQWDGKDKNGGRVTSGIYYYKIQGENNTFTGTVVVAR